MYLYYHAGAEPMKLVTRMRLGTKIAPMVYVAHSFHCVNCTVLRYVMFLSTEHYNQTVLNMSGCVYISPAVLIYSITGYIYISPTVFI